MKSINIKRRIIHLLGGVTAAECAKKDERIADILTAQREQFQKVMSVTTATPEGCERGAWCAACAFGKRYTARVGSPVVGGITHHTTYVCLRGCCDQFIAREDDPV